jgi:hypothetical protein
MSRAKLVLPFVLGCVASLIAGRAIVDVVAQGGGQGPNIHVCVDKDDVMRVVASTASCPNGQRSIVLGSAVTADGSGNPVDKSRDKSPNPSLDQAELKDLNVRLIKLEEMGCAALRANKVVAPFEVVDPSGKTVFTVTESAIGRFVGLLDGSGVPIDAIVADQKGGFFSAKGGDTRVSFGIVDPTIAGVNVSQGNKSRASLGKSLEKGNYRLAFVSSAGQPLAAIGEHPASKQGLLLINDSGGAQKAVMEVLDDGSGRVGIMSNSPRPIAALTDDGRGGVFYACGAGGRCDPMPVAAGTNERGVGLVATGPRFYLGGPTGAPGSFLIGK